mmetsp:Transcript_1039/g.1316  ORF Transcript_1039/g.1316 Transcript_1039/m.1316 type:complete len:384 (-) Transcript_1039:67-1218(-)
MLTKGMVLADLTTLLKVHDDENESSIDEKGFKYNFLKTDLAEFDFCVTTSVSKSDSLKNILPTLHSLQDMGNELVATASAAEALRDRISTISLKLGSEFQLLDENQVEKFLLHKHEHVHQLNQNHEENQKALERISASLQEAESTEAYLAALRTFPPSFNYPLHLHTRRGCNSANYDKDTRHQDCRDIERDRLRINGSEVYSGAELKYDGVVELLVDELEKLIKDRRIPGNSNVKLGLSRFARVLLNIGNRTNSGGDAYEVIMHILGCSDKVLITPNSNRADPVEIDFSVGVFTNAKDQSLDWGVCAELRASTYYNITDTVDLEKSHGLIVGRFRQSLGISLPVPQYSSELALDDGRSLLNRKDYLIKQDLAGSVDVTIELHP